MIELLVHQIDPALPVLAPARLGDAGLDLRARVAVEIAPRGGRAAVPTGIVVAVPPGYAGFVQPRSGLALHHGVTCLNSPGLIDAGFRGEIGVILVNTDGEAPFLVARGDRIAQLVVQRVEEVRVRSVPVDALPPSERGTGGFGHTGR